MPRHPRSLTVLAAFVAMGVGASSASAYQLGGQRWPGRTVTYHNTSRVNAAAVQDAVKAWNTSGVRIKFVPSTRRRAQIVIRTQSQGCVGFAQIGHRGGIGMTLGTGCERRYMALIAAHEFGHVLGLSHEARRCATMNRLLTTWVGDQCAQARGQAWQYRCRLLERDDVRGAIRLYGGSINPEAVGIAWCDRFAALAPPTEVAATATATTITLNWRDLANVNLANTDVAVRQGDCATLPVATSDHQSAFIQGSVTPGVLRSAPVDTAGPGPNCIELWSVDRYGRPSPIPVRVTVAVPAPITPTADFSSAPAGGSVANGTSAITFTATASDADSTTLTYSWEFGDGFFATGPNQNHTYSYDGTFVVTLVVADEGGRTATVTKNVVIDP